MYKASQKSCNLLPTIPRSKPLSVFITLLITEHYLFKINMSPTARALIAITSAHASLFGGSSHTTGVFIGEALHPYNVFKAAGFEVDIASEKGTWTEDWLSLQPGFLSDEERKQYDDKNSDFRSEMDQNVKAESLVDREVSNWYIPEVFFEHFTNGRTSMVSSSHRLAMRL
jgi:hypothetical protein